MGDYNINILNYSSDNETPGFIDTVYASSFFPPQKQLTILSITHSQRTF